MIIHIRASPDKTLCGESSGESISMNHLKSHVLQNRMDCCNGVWKRLCDKCLDLSR